LVGNLSKLGRAALALRRGDFSNAARQLGTRPRGTRLKAKDVSGRWLELQYGWIPLLTSSFEAAKAFEEVSNGPRKSVFTASGTRSVSYEASQGPLTFTIPLKGRAGRRLQYEMSEEMSVQRQMGLLDPLSIAWELTPWSFVIDWFLPIGIYLSNLNQIPTLKGRFLVTDFYKFERQAPACRWLGLPSPGWTQTVGDVPHFIVLSTQRIRTASFGPPPVPKPQFKIGGLNSSRRFWNAVSLAHQRFLR
jgi:hypothetical protein